MTSIRAGRIYSRNMAICALQYMCTTAICARFESQRILAGNLILAPKLDGPQIEWKNTYKTLSVLYDIIPYLLHHDILCKSQHCSTNYPYCRPHRSCKWMADIHFIANRLREHICMMQNNVASCQHIICIAWTNLCKQTHFQNTNTLSSYKPIFHRTWRLRCSTTLWHTWHPNSRQAPKRQDRPITQHSRWAQTHLWTLLSITAFVNK